MDELMKEWEKISRREFFRLVGAGLLASAAGGTVREKPPPLPTRPLGKTGFSSTIVGFGGAIIPNGPWETGVFAVQQAVSEGINYFDTASQYGFGESERMYGRVLSKHRDKIFLATKTLEREYRSSQREIEGSLKRLKSEGVDLLQIHSVNDMDTLRSVLGRNGSLRACEEVKRKGYTRFIGITGHRDPAVLEKALEEYPFDSILVPVSAMDAHLRDFLPLCEKAQKKGVAVIGMKVFGAGRVLPKLPLDLLLRFALSQPVSTVIIGFATPQEVMQVAHLARHFSPLSEEEKSHILHLAQPYAHTKILWWKE